MYIQNKIIKQYEKEISEKTESEQVSSGKLEFPAAKGGNSIIVTHTAKLNDNLVGTNYSIEWDTEKRSQRWSCYKLFSEIAGSTVSRYYSSDTTLGPDGQYPNDPDLPAMYQFVVDPYWLSGYNHGHICPSADRRTSLEANKQTFYMSNMQPQDSDFDAGIWSSIESRVHYWVTQFDTLYVCKGGTIDKPEHIIEYVCNSSHQSTRINENHIPVLRYFFMAILGRTGETFKATAIWINQGNYSSDSPKTYNITVGELQNLTGIDFFCNFSDEIETKVENVLRSQMQNEWAW